MGHNLNRRWNKMIKVSEEAVETRRRIMTMTVPHHSDPLRRVLITQDYLEEQSRDQTDYYTNYRKPVDDDNDTIFELLQVEERLSVTIPLRKANQTGKHNPRLRERLVAIARENPLTTEELLTTPEGSELNGKIQALLDKTHTTRVEWTKEGMLYNQCRRNFVLKKLHKIQSAIVRVVTE